jgi:hypothetical protein
MHMWSVTCVCVSVVQPLLMASFSRTFFPADPCYELGQRLHSAIRAQTLTIHPHTFFNGPKFFDQLPGDLVAALHASPIVFVKGARTASTVCCASRGL